MNHQNGMLVPPRALDLEGLEALRIAASLVIGLGGRNANLFSRVAAVVCQESGDWTHVYISTLLQFFPLECLNDIKLTLTFVVAVGYRDRLHRLVTC